jgi:hypothetical protein
MEAPRFSSTQRASLQLPEIHVQDSNAPAAASDRQRLSGRSFSYSATSPSSAMSIPNAREPVPPPLPPPPRIPDFNGGSPATDIAWQWGNSQEGGWGKASTPIDPKSSLYGSFSARNSVADDRPGYDRRGSSASTIKSINGLEVRRETYPRIDEGFVTLSSGAFGRKQ